MTPACLFQDDALPVITRPGVAPSCRLTKRRRSPSSAQPAELPFDHPPRLTRSESDRIYALVLALRTAGAQVYRHGGHHKVNGRIVDHRQLASLAGSFAGAPPAAEYAAKPHMLNPTSPGPACHD